MPDDKFAATCVLVDKLEKVKIEEIQGEMEVLGLSKDVIEGLLETLKIRDFDELAKKVEKPSFHLPHTNPQTSHTSQSQTTLAREIPIVLSYLGVTSPGRGGIRGDEEPAQAFRPRRGLRFQGLARLRRLCRTLSAPCPLSPALHYNPLIAHPHSSFCFESLRCSPPRAC